MPPFMLFFGCETWMLTTQAMGQGTHPAGSATLLEDEKALLEKPARASCTPSAAAPPRSQQSRNEKSFHNEMSMGTSPRDKHESLAHVHLLKDSIIEKMLKQSKWMRKRLASCKAPGHTGFGKNTFPRGPCNGY